MALSLIRKFQVIGHYGKRIVVKQAVFSRFYSLYEPDYLETGKPKIPVYPTLNIQIRGYTYPVLESYQALIHKIVNNLECEVEDSWAYPAQQLRIQRYKPNSETVVAEYQLNIYERNIQVDGITGVLCPVLIRMLEAALPEGVMLNVDIWNPEYEKGRFVPDKQLLDLKEELGTISKKKA